MTASNPWNHARHCDAAEREIERFAASVGAADPGAKVPTCPEWTIAGLAEHVGGVHRWATTLVRALSPKPVPRRDVAMDLPGDPAAYAGWLREGGEALMAVLRAADPDAPVWAWGADQHVRFWSRRMLHETAVHRADAELAAGTEPEITADVATDGVDEFLVNVSRSRAASRRIDDLAGAGDGAIALVAGEAAWRVTLGTDGFAWRRDDALTDALSAAPADVTVRAAPADLLLFAYGRRTAADPRVEVSGDTELLDRWTQASAI